MSKTRPESRSPISLPPAPTAEEVYNAGLDILESFKLSVTPFEKVEETIQSGVDRIHSAADMYMFANDEKSERWVYRQLANASEWLGDKLGSYVEKFLKPNPTKINEAIDYLNLADHCYEESVKLVTQYSRDISKLINLHFSRLYVMELKSEIDVVNKDKYLAAIASYISTSPLAELTNKFSRQALYFKDLLRSYQEISQYQYENKSEESNENDIREEHISRQELQNLREQKLQESINKFKTNMQKYLGHQTVTEDVISQLMLKMADIYSDRALQNTVLQSTTKGLKQNNQLKVMADELYKASAFLGNSAATPKVSPLPKNQIVTLPPIETRKRKLSYLYLQEPNFFKQEERDNLRKAISRQGAKDYLNNFILNQQKQITTLFPETADKILDYITEKLSKLELASTKRLKKS